MCLSKARAGNVLVIQHKYVKSLKHQPYRKKKHCYTHSFPLGIIMCLGCHKIYTETCSNTPRPETDPARPRTEVPKTDSSRKVCAKHY